MRPVPVGQPADAGCVPVETADAICAVTDDDSRGRPAPVRGERITAVQQVRRLIRVGSSTAKYGFGRRKSCNLPEVSGIPSRYLAAAYGRDPSSGAAGNAGFPAPRRFPPGSQAAYQR